MSPSILVLLAAVAVALVAGERLFRVWLRYRGARLVTCPENHQPAGVKLDGSHVAVSALTGPADLRLSSCSRWPEKAGCGQECLAQIAAAPEGCLVRNILAHWYEGKSCVSCGMPVGTVDWKERNPGLLTAEGEPLDWDDVAAEKLPAVLATAKPLCFSCCLAAGFARQHPELVTDRHRRVD